jgi:hypothetical protein
MTTHKVLGSSPVDPVAPASRSLTAPTTPRSAKPSARRCKRRAAARAEGIEQ